LNEKSDILRTKTRTTTQRDGGSRQKESGRRAGSGWEQSEVMWRNRQEKEVAWAGREGGNEKGLGRHARKKNTRRQYSRDKFVCLFNYHLVLEEGKSY
jgi:hypothetical protein